MPMLKLDIIEGARVIERDGKVSEATRLAVVTGITPGSNWAAQALAVAGLPATGNSHPHYPKLYLRNRYPQARAPSVIFIELQYRTPEDQSTEPPSGFESVVSGGSSLNSLTSAKDRDGNDLFTVETVDDGAGSYTTSTEKQGGTIDVMEAQHEQHYERVELSAAPGIISSGYAGKINSATWGGAAPGIWMCTGVRFTLQDRTTSPPAWRFSYDFQADRRGWQPRLVHINPETGKPCNPLIEGKSTKEVIWYYEANFNALNL